eukprot:COSAG02_NODE_61971_length_267_cov_0.613095_1_plen_40_part_10
MLHAQVSVSHRSSLLDPQKQHLLPWVRVLQDPTRSQSGTV